MLRETLHGKLSGIGAPEVKNFFLGFLHHVAVCCSTSSTDRVLKRTTSQFVYLEKFSLNFSNSSFAIRVNLLHP